MFAAYYFNLQYAFVDLKAYVDILINVSGMVFTIMGIWIAFLYPNALSRLIDPKKVIVADFSESLTETKRLESIVGSVLKSGLVVVAILGLALTKLLVYGSPLYLTHYVAMKAVALSLVITVSYVQAEALFGVIFANIMFINDLHRRREERESAKDT